MTVGVAWLSHGAAIRPSEQRGRLIRAGTGLVCVDEHSRSRSCPNKEHDLEMQEQVFRLGTKAKRLPALMSKQNVKSGVITLSRESASCSRMGHKL
jgi:hypothetical protein